MTPSSSSRAADVLAAVRRRAAALAAATQSYPRRPRRLPHAPLRAQGHRAVPRLRRRPQACRAMTSAASRCACSTRSSAAPRRRACSRRCASATAWPTPCTRSRARTRTRARSACMSARAPTTCAEAMRVVDGSWRGCAASPATAEELARAKENLKGRVLLALESTGRAHEPARLGDAGRGAAARARRGRRDASTP